MPSFKTISEIKLGEDATWQDSLFLSFDIDWCADDILSDTISLVEKADVFATWFITHETDLLWRLRENPKFELGVHPNFNRLLMGDQSLGKNFCEVLDHYRKIVPEAVSVRSHSITQSSLIHKHFIDVGLKYDCNCFIPESAYDNLRPWGLWKNQLVRVPFSWADDVHCLHDWEWGKDGLPKAGSINVYDFHPIHVYLNSESLRRYERTRELHQNASALIGERNSSFGTRSHLIALMEGNL